RIAPAVRNLEAGQQRVRNRAPDERDVAHPGELEVADVLTAPAQEAAGLQPRKACAGAARDRVLGARRIGPWPGARAEGGGAAGAEMPRPMLEDSRSGFDINARGIDIGSSISPSGARQAAGRGSKGLECGFGPETESLMGTIDIAKLLDAPADPDPEETREWI